MNRNETTAYLGVGSNRGDREAYLQRALRALSTTDGIADLRLSPVYETEAAGAAGPGRFLNAVVELHTTLAPDQLLFCLQEIEESLGRGSDRAGPRTIDLDILFYGGLVAESDTLTIPHPRLHERDFVLVPLADLAPDVIHPDPGIPISELLDRLPYRDPTLAPCPFRFARETNSTTQK